MDDALPRFIQVSIVKSCSCKFVPLPTTTAPPVPLNTNPFPTRPVPNVTLLDIIPLLPPTKSHAFVSARHQLTRLDVNATQGGVVLTVSTALVLLVVPIEFLT